MKQKIRLLGLLVWLTLGAMGQAQGAGAGVLFQAVSDGRPQSQLVLIDQKAQPLTQITLLQGGDREVQLFATGASQRALVQVADKGLFLIDTASGNAIPIDLPTAVQRSVRLNHPRFKQQDNQRWYLLSNTRLTFLYLLDLRSGQITDVLSLIDKSLDTFIAVTLSPDEAHLILVSDRGSWLIPTERPTAFRPMSEGLIFGVAFSSDGQRFLFSQRAASGGFELLVGSVNDAALQTLATDTRSLRATFVPEKNEALIVRETSLTHLTLSDLSERPLLSFEGGARFPVVNASSQMLFAFDKAPFLPVWHWFDLPQDRRRTLGELEGFELTPTSNALQRWIMFQKGSIPGRESQLRALDMETGNTHPITTTAGAPLFDGRSRRFIAMLDASSTGRYYLVSGLDTGGNTQLWLIDALKGQARTLQNGVSEAAFSPDDQTLFIAADNPSGPQIVLADVDGGQVRAVGEGLNPVWVRP